MMVRAFQEQGICCLGKAHQLGLIALKRQIIPSNQSRLKRIAATPLGQNFGALHLADEKTFDLFLVFGVRKIILICSSCWLSH